jgi:hypothetical protein
MTHESVGVIDTAKSNLAVLLILLSFDTTKSKPSGVIDTTQSRLSGVIDTAESIARSML